MSGGRRQILHENYTGMISVSEKMGTIKSRRVSKRDCRLPLYAAERKAGILFSLPSQDTETGAFMDNSSGKIGNRISETGRADVSFYRTAAVCLAVYLILALAGACAIAAERMGWETPPGEYYEMETDMTEFEGPLEEIGLNR